MPDVYEERWLGLPTFPTVPMLNVMGDIDDVFFPWADTVHEKCHIAGLHDGRAPWRTWHMWEDYGCSKEAWLDVIAEATIEGMYVHTEPYPGAVAAWNRLRWHFGQYVGLHLVTARGFMEHAEDIRKWTPAWVEEYGIAHDTLTFAKNKPDVPAQLGIPRFDYAIDDGVHNYEALDSDGVKVYLLSRPHNRDFPAERRVETIDEFVDIIIKEAAA